MTLPTGHQVTGTIEGIGQTTKGCTKYSRVNEDGEVGVASTKALSLIDWHQVYLSISVRQ